MRSVLTTALLIVIFGVATRVQDFHATTLDGSAPAAVFDLTAAGRLVGSITPAGQLNARAAFWRTVDAAPIELPLLTGTNWSRAFGVNARGQIVGLIQDRSVSPPVLYAAFWEGESAAPIALAGGTRAVAINSAGLIAGNISVGSASRGAVWPDATSEPIELGTFGGASSGANDLDDAGQVVGDRDARLLCQARTELTGGVANTSSISTASADKWLNIGSGWGWFRVGMSRRKLRKIGWSGFG